MELALASSEPEITGFHDAATGSVQYILADAATRHCAILDPVLDFDSKSAGTRTTPQTPCWPTSARRPLLGRRLPARCHRRAGRHRRAGVARRQEDGRFCLADQQVNIAGGRLPPPDGNGRRYLKIPLDAFPGAPWS